MMDDPNGAGRKSRRPSNNPDMKKERPDDQAIDIPVDNTPQQIVGAGFKDEAPSQDMSSPSAKPTPGFFRGNSRKKSLDQMGGGFFRGQAPKKRDEYFTGQT